MKAYLFNVVVSISLLASSCALATDGGLANASTMDNADSNGLVQSSSNAQDQDPLNDPSLDDRANNGLGVGVTRDGETMGEED